MSDELPYQPQTVLHQPSTINNFDRTMGMLDGLPDVSHTSPTPIRVVPAFGIGVHMYSVQTFRQLGMGDTIFIEHTSAEGLVRMVLPPKVAEAIARQRDALTTKVRKKTAKRVANERKEAGILPGFMKKRVKK